MKQTGFLSLDIYSAKISELDLCRADPKLFTAQWTMLLPSNDVLQHRNGRHLQVGAAAVRRPYRKRSRDTSEAIPLMEGEGRFLRVMGFNQSQRAVFVQILMRFCVGKFDWAEFVPRLKQKTLEEIKEYGKLFMEHISEEITDSPTFSDNVPKEGLRIDDVLVRIGTLSLIRDKIKAFSAGSPIFPNDILSRYPGLKGGRLWNEHHDKLLLQAVMKHGYGRWQAIVDDKDLRIQEVICQEMNLPFISTPALGAPQVQNVSSGTSQPQVHPLGTSQAQSSASGVSQPHVPAPGSSQPQNGVNSEHAEAPGIEAKGTTPGSESAADAAHGATDTASRSQLSQDQSTMYHFREMKRRLVDIVKKRVLLLEKGLNAELQKEYYAEDKTNGVPNDDTGRKVTDIATPCSEELDTKKIDQLPQVEIISPSEITTVACDKKQDRLDMANLFNEMSRIVINTAPNSAETCYGPASLELRKNLAPLQNIGDEMNKILSLERTSSPCDKLAPKVDHNADDTTLGAGAMDIDTAADKTNQEANPGSESNNVSGAESAGDGCADVEVEEKQEDEIIIDDNCSVSGGVCEALTIAFSMIGEIYSRVGASLPVEIWKSVVEALRKVMDILASNNLVFYIELLHCLHLVLAEPRGYLTDHVAGFVAALRIFFRYGLVNVPSVMNQATNHMKGVGSTSQNIPFEVSNQSKSGPYRPPHLRKKVAGNQQHKDECLIFPRNEFISSDSDCSDNDGSVMDNSKGHFAKVRLAAIVCVQDLCRADPKLFTAQWTMLLPSNDVLQHRKYDTTLMSCLLSDPSLKGLQSFVSAASFTIGSLS